MPPCVAVRPPATQPSSGLVKYTDRNSISFFTFTGSQIVLNLGSVFWAVADGFASFGVCFLGCCAIAQTPASKIMPASRILALEINSM